MPLGLTRGRAAFDPTAPAPTTPPYDMTFPLPRAVTRFEDVSAAVLRSLGETSMPLSTLFFSRENVDMLQDGLQARIREKMGLRIGRQSDRDMLLLMRRVYLETASNPSGPNSRRRAKVLAEVARLDELVSQVAEDVVSRNIIRYLLYRKNLAQPKILMHPGATR